MNLDNSNFQSLSLIKKTKYLYKKMSFGEKGLIFIFSVIAIFSIILALISYNKQFLLSVPSEGGRIVEGVIGTPRFINPLYATSPTDRDLTILIYSGLTRKSGDTFIPDLSDRYEVSEDGLEYTFYLKDDLKFHDNKPLTAEDVIFTIQKAQNSEIKSPKRSNWEGVAVEKIDDLTVKFTLSQPHAPFLQYTTLGILPKHIWSQIEISDFSLNSFNVNPIGSGPFQIYKIKRNSINVPEHYTLRSFRNFALGKPFLKEIQFIFSQNQEDLVAKLRSGEVSAIHGIDPELAYQLREENYNVKSYTLPWILGVFFNQNQANVLASTNIRTVLDLLVPKKEIKDEVFFGYSEIIDSTIPKNLSMSDEELFSDELELKSEEERTTEARTLLESSGWEKNEEGVYISDNDGDKRMLAFSLSIPSTAEIVASAEKIVEKWNNFGAQVDLKVYDIADFNQLILRPRNYDAIFFGMIISNYYDLYAFWHSSQRNDPGLNIAGYANIDADKYVLQLRDQDPEENKQEILMQFENEIRKDTPAIFTYSPKFIYISPRNLTGLRINNLVTSEERFLNVYEWYMSTEEVLNVFINSN